MSGVRCVGQTVGAGGTASKHDGTTATAPRAACSETVTKAEETAATEKAAQHEADEQIGQIEGWFQTTEVSLEGMHRELT